VNSSSRSPSRNCCSNTGFSPTYEDTILRICRVPSSVPRPKDGSPALLLTTVSRPTPLSFSATISFSGIPQTPNPPAAIDIPSKTAPRSASSADANTLLIASLLRSAEQPDRGGAGCGAYPRRRSTPRAAAGAALV